MFWKLFVFCYLFATSAYAANPIPIIPGESVASVALGTSDKTGIQKLIQNLGQPVSGKDTEYEGQVVYFYFFGRKNPSTNSYPLQVYSDVKHRIFIFEINTPDFVTPEGIRVGSSENDLLKAYGSRLKKLKRGSIYLKYTLGGRKGTDFYVRNQKVQQILIRDY